MIPFEKQMMIRGCQHFRTPLSVGYVLVRYVFSCPWIQLDLLLCKCILKVLEYHGCIWKKTPFNEWIGRREIYRKPQIFPWNMWVPVIFTFNQSMNSWQILTVYKHYSFLHPIFPFLAFDISPQPLKSNYLRSEPVRQTPAAQKDS